MIRSAAIAVSLVALAALPLRAQTGEELEPTAETDATRVATRGANFLNLAVGARARALAGAQTASPTGIEALYWNTAAIAFDSRFRLGASLTELYGDLDINHFFGGIILPIGENRFAVSVNQLSSGEIQRTDEDFPEGGNPQFGDTFEWNATAIGLHFARAITDRLAFGLAGKFIQEGIPGARAEFLAADIGVTFQTGLFGTQMGASFINIGSDAEIKGSLTQRQIDQTLANSNIFEVRRIIETDLGTNKVELPTGFRIGISTQVWGGPEALVAGQPYHSVRFLADIVDTTDSPLQPAFALEYNFREILYLRGGKRWPNEDQIDHDFANGMSFGGGLSLPISERRLLIDYSYTDVGDLDNVQTFALELAI